MDSLQHFIHKRFEKNITGHETINPTPGKFSPYTSKIHKDLQLGLQKIGIQSLYSHQANAFESISNGNDTVLVSQTASGKTVSFLLPILNDFLNSPTPFSVLFLYPTKALARDQEALLSYLLQTINLKAKIGTFDGDTSREERTLLKRNGNFIITNPDMLHAGILPNHSRGWKNFLSRLKYIVVDEVHTYRGAFGSHVSNVFRRLLRVCECHTQLSKIKINKHPIFICSSATIGNPKEHVNALFQKNFTVIANDTSPRPKRHLYCLNPSLMTLSNSKFPGIKQFRKGPISIAIPLIRAASLKKIRTICFARSRQGVERLYRAVIDQHLDLKTSVKPYRGGLLPSERRHLERDLFNGKINTIITTNALELGIDIGDLDLCILCGHPGSMASFWQQAGRVGRKGKDATIVYIAKDTPIDQYLVNNSEFFNQAPIENAWLNANNPYILLQHLPCTAHEYPLRENEPLYPSKLYHYALTQLKQSKTVKPYKSFYRYALPDYPSKGVQLRGLTDYDIEIYHNSIVIGKIDPIGARGSLYKDAIYQHLGKRYMSLDLDLDKKLCTVEPVDVDYYTEAVWENRIHFIEKYETFNRFDSHFDFGAIHVNKQPKMYKKIKERSYENIGFGPITLSAFEYDTTGFCLRPSKLWQDEIETYDKRWIHAALYGLAYILKHASPSLCMGDISDIETDVSLNDSEQPSEDNVFTTGLFLYDRHEGGVGYAEKICDLIEPSLNLCLNIIQKCPCDTGCPSCIPPMPPHLHATTQLSEDPRDKEMETYLIESNATHVCTVSLLNNLLTGQIDIPEVTLHHRIQELPHLNYPDDHEFSQMSKQLGRAAKILDLKRNRLHK